MNFCVIIPAYNEEKRLGNVIKEVKKYTSNIIVVDDGSRDKTGAEAENEKATVIRHITNLGKGAALKTGCDYALSRGFEKIIVMDADGQHEPRFIPEFLDGLKNKELVFGCRTASKNMPLIFRIGNKAIDFATKTFYGISIDDTQSGYRAFTAEAYKKIRWNARNYSVESEMIARAGRNKIKYSTIRISTIYGDKYKGTTVIDGIKIALNLIKWKIFNELKKQN
jgi:glycosyltransferase involved in cell wall biosynthesis